MTSKWTIDNVGKLELLRLLLLKVIVF